jgi:hypothetical protein
MVKVIDDGIFPVPREKVWKLIQAHETNGSAIHPNVRSSKQIKKEGNANVIEQQVDMGGQIVRHTLKISANPPDSLTIEYLDGPMTGKMVNTYTDVPEGTKVSTVADMTSKIMKDKELEAAIRQLLDKSFNEDLQYLKQMK